ncbi:MAG: CheR family methyltransferase [Longimicrobiales bacterium]
MPATEPCDRPGRDRIGGGATPGLALHIAQGELSEQEQEIVLQIKRRVHERVGLFCEGYKQRCFRRRLAVRLRASRARTLDEYLALLDRDDAEYARLVAAVMINVSKFFRNPEVWQVLRDRTLPDLLDRFSGGLRLWSAGCAGGEEAYSLAIVLLELATERGEAAAAAQHTILATDLEPAVLAHAREARFDEAALSETEAAVRRRWFTPGPPFVLDPAAQALVRFEERDLIRDRPPQRQHLILCRNVLIYLERPIQEALFEAFRESLHPGGYLVLGKVETLTGARVAGFETVVARERIYRRV